MNEPLDLDRMEKCATFVDPPDPVLQLIAECRVLRREVERRRIEHDRAIEFLRRICEEVGDNDWPDDLELTDIIDKHLVRYIYSD